MIDARSYTTFSLQTATITAMERKLNWLTPLLSLNPLIILKDANKACDDLNTYGTFFHNYRPYTL
jgi:hypothetical protein